MAINFEEKIQYINHDISSYSFFSNLPDRCPKCSYAVSPEYILYYSKNAWTTELLCGCPRHECGALFFAVYEDTHNTHIYTLVGCYPYSKVNKVFPEEVSELSSDFVTIYNQAHHAEQEGLDLICGVGYRKALEYLIKDFAIKNNPTDIDKIQSMPLQQCVQKFIDQSDIKDMAERAIWLGNDETHYVRKWESKDLNDLKNLIDLTVYFISMSLKAKKYKEDMFR